MAVYVVTGKLGAGKTLVAVSRIQRTLAKGGIVATNLNLKLHHFPQVGRYAKQCRVMRIADKPTLEDLEAIGRGNLSYDESKNGLIVLDECGTWFNSRNWSDKSRQPVIDWFLHARKLGWDVIFIIQDISLMDKQAREALAEHVVYCRRLDKLNIPIIGGLISVLSGGRLPLPKVHFGIVKYGDNPQSLTVDKWIYTGTDLYAAYDTKQIFTSDRELSPPFCPVSPYYTHGIFAVKRDAKYYMRMTKIYFKKMNRVWLMASFLALGAGVGFFYKSRQINEQLSNMPVASAQANTTKTDHTIDELPRLSINSFAQMGYDVNVSFKDAKGKIYYSFDLMKSGYALDIKDSCHITLRKRNYIQQVTCEG
ncbi:gene I product [Lineavirus I22]|uniref:Gene 1 protein n=2 Tax=Enterobacteria phage I2-2 TaxID=10869 RepID=G1P_BPI22|nr:gene I product [Lineavirus I22]P15418.1 RecName: Full=Gene 1 protein; AltName: Full=G1P [Lineavirus I22]CAA32519.1 gene I product [Lineavirus I22]